MVLVLYSNLDITYVTCSYFTHACNDLFFPCSTTEEILAFSKHCFKKVIEYLYEPMSNALFLTGMIYSRD